MKNKTLLEAATDMLLNKSESVVAEAVPSINMKNLKSKDIFDLLGRISDTIFDKYIGEDGDDADIRIAYTDLINAIDDLHEVIINAGLFESSESEEDGEKHDLEEATEVDSIAAKVAELKVGDKTNFGVVVAKSSNSVTFKAKDLPKTKITFNQRKMGSRDYVLSALRMIK
jgi:hypothetical protein